MPCIIAILACSLVQDDFEDKLARARDIRARSF